MDMAAFEDGRAHHGLLWATLPQCDSPLLQIPKDIGFKLETSVFSAFIPQVSSLALPAQSSCTHKLCSVPGVLPQVWGLAPSFPSSPYSHTAGGDVPEPANEVQTVSSHCSIPDYWTRRNLVPARCGCPGLCHPSQLQPGSSLPPQPGELKHSLWQWGRREFELGSGLLPRSFQGRCWVLTRHSGGVPNRTIAELRNASFNAGCKHAPEWAVVCFSWSEPLPRVSALG